MIRYRVLMYMFMCAGITPGFSYLQTIHTLENTAKMPKKLLHAIAYIESGRVVNKRKTLWPWTINVQGKGYTFDTKDDAIKSIQEFQRLGITSIDVGIMQINLKHHPHAFQSLEQALDPIQNITYGSRFLMQLYKKYGSWKDAVRYYHSSNPAVNQKYLQRVLHVLKSLDGESHSLYVHTPHMTPGIQHTSQPSILHNLKGYIPMKSEGHVISDDPNHTAHPVKTLPITVSFFPLSLPQAVGESSLHRPIKTRAKTQSHQSIKVFPLTQTPSGVMPLH